MTLDSDTTDTQAAANVAAALEALPAVDADNVSVASVKTGNVRGADNHLSK